MPQDSKYSIVFLRAFCAIEVFFLHYCAERYGHWTTTFFCGAVPTFLLMSAYLYGLRGASFQFGKASLLKRFRSLSSSYYPFLVFVLLGSLWIERNVDSANLWAGFAADFFYLGGLVGTNLPRCGHLWFMTTLMLCYIMLRAVSGSTLIRKWMTTPKYVIVAFICVILSGFVYRGGQMVHMFAYILLFYNADKIRRLVSTGTRTMLAGGMLVCCYLLMFVHIDKMFHYGIYLTYMITCVIGLLTILFAEKFVTACKPNAWVCYISEISMEIYLVHHLFVYDCPLYVSLPVTIVLAVALHKIAQRIKIRLL